MASHHVAIAKASFSAGLLRPDPTSTPRDEIASFHAKLDKALSQCTPANIQSCKSWLLQNVVPSQNRVGVLGKYLVALSGSTDPTSKGDKKSSAKRMRLHILYLLNDLLHHTKFHDDTTSSLSILSGGIQPFLVELFDRVGAFDAGKYPKHHRRVNDVLDVWTQNTYFSTNYIDKLRDTVDHAAKLQPDESDQIPRDGEAAASKSSTYKDAPFIMPATHGDPSTPYYDLPAGNMMPHIIPNSSAPIRPELVKPLQFVAGPADQMLVDAVKSFLIDVTQIYNPTTEPDEITIADIDELGQPIVRDEVTGERIGGDAYYGWSRQFCEKMKRRRDGTDQQHTRSRRYSSSRSQSRSPRKRRRYSESVSKSPSPIRSRSQNRRHARARSPSQSSTRSNSQSRHPRPSAYRNGNRRSRSLSLSRSRCLSRSHTPPPRRDYPSRSHSYSPALPPPPPPSLPPPPTQQSQFQHFPVPFSGSAQDQGPYQPSPPPPPSAGGPPLNYPAPPPRPLGYTGPWPPPPPPTMPPNMMSMNTNPSMAAPFPPPSPQHGGPNPYQQHHPYGGAPPPPSPQIRSAFPQSHSPPGQGQAQGQGQWGSPPAGPGAPSGPSPGPYQDGYGYGYGGSASGPGRSGHGGGGRGKGRGRGRGGGW